MDDVGVPPYFGKLPSYDFKIPAFSSSLCWSLVQANERMARSRAAKAWRHCGLMVLPVRKEVGGIGTRYDPKIGCRL